MSDNSLYSPCFSLVLCASAWLTWRPPHNGQTLHHLPSGRGATGCSEDRLPLRESSETSLRLFAGEGNTRRQCSYWKRRWKRVKCDFRHMICIYLANVVVVFTCYTVVPKSISCRFTLALRTNILNICKKQPCKSSCVYPWQYWEPGPTAERRDEGWHPGERPAASRRQKRRAHPADC